MTTKDRINKFQNETYIYQKKFIWYLESGDLFFDGIIVKEGHNKGESISKDEGKGISTGKPTSN